MNLSEYQTFSRTTAIYPKAQALEYLTLGLCSEAGEFAGKLKKRIRDGNFEVIGAVHELGDIAWYFVRLCDELGYDAEGVLEMNAQKLQDRKERNVLKGNGDTR